MENSWRLLVCARIRVPQETPATVGSLAVVEILVRGDNREKGQAHQSRASCGLKGRLYVLFRVRPEKKGNQTLWESSESCEWIPDIELWVVWFALWEFGFALSGLCCTMYFSPLEKKETLYFDNAETHNRDVLSLFKRKYHSCIKILNLKLLHSF